MMWIVVFVVLKIAEELIFPRIYICEFIINSLQGILNSVQLQQLAVDKSH